MSFENKNHRNLPKKRELTQSLRKKWPFLFGDDYHTIRMRGIPIKFGFKNEFITGKIETMQLQDSQQVVLTLNPLDAKGAPAGVTAGSVKWSVKDTTIATITVNPDNELEATLLGVSGGVTEVDVDFEDVDGTPVHSFSALTIIAGDAVSATITAGEATAQPAADNQAAQ